MGVRSRGTAGGAQPGLSFTGSQITLTVPNEANVAEIFVRDAPIAFFRDGSAPSTSQGFIAYPDDIIILNSRDECDDFIGTRATGATASGDVEYFTDISG